MNHAFKGFDLGRGCGAYVMGRLRVRVPGDRLFCAMYFNAIRIALAGVAAIVLCSSAHAQDAAEDRGRLHFKAGASYFDASDYREALLCACHHPAQLLLQREAC